MNRNSPPAARPAIIVDSNCRRGSLPALTPDLPGGASCVRISRRYAGAAPGPGGFTGAGGDTAPPRDLAARATWNKDGKSSSPLSLAPEEAPGGGDLFVGEDEERPGSVGVLLGLVFFRIAKFGDSRVRCSGVRLGPHVVPHHAAAVAVGLSPPPPVPGSSGGGQAGAVVEWPARRKPSGASCRPAEDATGRLFMGPCGQRPGHGG
jgi:hypothetical protein